MQLNHPDQVTPLTIGEASSFKYFVSTSLRHPVTDDLHRALTFECNRFICLKTLRNYFNSLVFQLVEVHKFF
jgi:hypothetical protein